MNLTAQAAQAATDGVFYGNAFPSVVRVNTDSRTIAGGQTFLALRGERFDGHAFVDQALARGAAALIVDDASAIPPGASGLVVADTTRAFMSLAGAHRRHHDVRVIGVTGSTGKTTTKHLLAQLLQRVYGNDAVLATPSNENNEIGVSKLLLQLDDVHKAVVVEMGARHYGEISGLAAVARPEIGVLTNIGEAHLEIFGSRERLAETKWGLFDYGARAVLCAADIESLKRAPSLASPPIWFGTHVQDVHGVWIPDSATLVQTFDGLRTTRTVDVPIPGAYNRSNLSAAVAAALLLGIDLDKLVTAIPTLTLPPGRFESIAIPGTARLIYDAYNANLSGMMAALDAFAVEPARRRVAVLGSMAELGEQSAEMHERVGAKVASLPIDTLLVGGDYAAEMRAGAIGAGFPLEHVVSFSGNDHAARWIRTNTGAADAVLLKGSRKYAMEQIVARLRSDVEEARV